MQEPQVARDGELRGDDLDRVLLDPAAAPVDLVVAADDLLGQLDVARRRAP